LREDRVANGFFFSCADEDVADVSSFFDDLNHEIEVRALDTGYFYRQPRHIGVDWSRQAAKALREAKVFVPVYSPAFLRSQTWGREYAAFLRRLEVSGLSDQRIVPIWWIPPIDPIPARISKIVDTRTLLTPDEGRGPSDLKMIFEARNVRQDNPYRELLAKVAETIIKGLHSQPLLQPGPEIDLVRGEDLFGLAARMAPVSSTDAGDAKPPIKRVNFIVLVGTSTQMAALALRQARAYYGPDTGSWNPFHPNAKRPLVLDAFEVALAEDFLPTPVLDVADLQVFISESERRKELVVLLVDPWVVHVDDVAERLRAYDKYQFLNSAVIIPTASSDPETWEQLQMLRQKLFRVIPRTMQGVPGLYRDDLADLGEFCLTLRKVLHLLLVRAVNSAPPVFVSRIDANAAIPVLQGPGG
jgi:FxsC-like protein